MSWEKLPPLESNQIHHSGCLNCPATAKHLKMNSRIAVGFGFAGVMKDGETIWFEPPFSEWDELPTVMKFENMARKDPDHDWRIVMDGPLHGETYQRHGRNDWVIVASNRGFA